MGALRYGFDGSSEVGFLVSAGVGYDFGARGKKSASWAGFSTTVRGFFASSERDEAGGAGLYLGVYAW